MFNWSKICDFSIQDWSSNDEGRNIACFSKPKGLHNSRPVITDGNEELLTGEWSQLTGLSEANFLCVFTRPAPQNEAPFQPFFNDQLTDGLIAFLFANCLPAFNFFFSLCIHSCRCLPLMGPPTCGTPPSVIAASFGSSSR